MNETTIVEPAEDLHEPMGDHHGDHDDHHPSDGDYIKIAIGLGILTLIEVGTYFESVHKMPEWLLYVVLIVLMIVKFVIVGLYFMHLKFDSKVYTWMFTAGMGFAIGVYFIMLFAQNFFG